MSDIFVSNDSTKREFKEKYDDVIPEHVKIGTCDKLSVFPCIILIVNSCLLLKPYQGTPTIVFAIWLSKHNIWCGTATQHNTRTKRQFSPLRQLVPNEKKQLGTVNKGNHSSLCKWCPYLALLYKKWPQQFLENVIETVDSQNWYNHIIGFDTSFHSII